MGSSKTHQYNAGIIDLALLARAIGHPARAQIFEILKAEGVTKSRDLSIPLNLCESTIHEHLLKMREAGIVHLTYHFRGCVITPVPDRMDDLVSFLSRPGR